MQHLYLGERVEDTEIIKALSKDIFLFQMPYISITPTFSVCHEHGYIAGEHFVPECGSEAEYTQVTGYLRRCKTGTTAKRVQGKSEICGASGI